MFQTSKEEYLSFSSLQKNIIIVYIASYAITKMLPCIGEATLILFVQLRGKSRFGPIT